MRALRSGSHAPDVTVPTLQVTPPRGDSEALGRGLSLITAHRQGRDASPTLRPQSEVQGHVAPLLRTAQPLNLSFLG